MKKLYALFISILALVSLGAGCAPRSDTSVLKIATSFYPLYFFTKEIVGTNAEVTNLTPAGVEPHDFEPTARDIALVQDSTLLITNGLGFEPWIDDIKSETEKKRVRIVETGKEFEFLDIPFDPHVWLSPLTAQTQVRMIQKALVEVDPEQGATYEKNTALLLDKLNQLDKEFREGLKECRHNTFVTSHAAFGHLAREYGLTQKSIAGISPEAEPSLRELAELAAFAKENNVRYIFFESLVSPKIAETLAKEVGAETLVLNPLEGLTKEETDQGKDYFSVMRENLGNLRKALECK